MGQHQQMPASTASVIASDEEYGPPLPDLQEGLGNRALIEQIASNPGAEDEGMPILDLLAHLRRQTARGVLDSASSLLRAWDIGADALEELLPEFMDSGASAEEMMGHHAAAALDAFSREHLAADPEYEGNTLATDLPRAIGGVAAFIAGGAATAAAKGSASVAMLVAGGASSGEGHYTAAKESGADTGTARTAFALGALGGALEGLILGRLLGRLDTATGGQASQLIQQFLITGAENLAESFAQAVTDNLIAQALYDEDRALFEGVVEAGAVDGLSALVFHTAVAGARAGKLRLGAAEAADGAPPSDGPALGERVLPAGEELGAIPERLRDLGDPQRIRPLLTRAGGDPAKLEALVTRAGGVEPLERMLARVDDADALERLLADGNAPERVLALLEEGRTPQQVAQRLADVRRVREIESTEIERHDFHGTNSDMLDGLAKTEGKILSERDLIAAGHTRTTGEGEAFSRGGGPKAFISVGEGEAGMGTSLAYAEANRKLTHYNPQLYTMVELQAEIERMRLVVENFDTIDKVQSRYPKEAFASNLKHLERELAIREALPPDSPRALGGPDNVSNFPILFEFDPKGLNSSSHEGTVPGGPLGGEGDIYDPIDLKERLIRVYAPEANLAEARERVAKILGHDRFEALPLEAVREGLSTDGYAVGSADATANTLSSIETWYRWATHDYKQEILVTKLAEEHGLARKDVDEWAIGVGGAEKLRSLIDRAGGPEPFKSLLDAAGDLEALSGSLEGPQGPMPEIFAIDKLAWKYEVLPVWLREECRQIGGLEKLNALIDRAGGWEPFMAIADQVNYKVLKIQEKLDASPAP